jgi:hypothetical protein
MTMNLDGVHLAWRCGAVEETQAVLHELEAELATTKARRDKILADIAVANDASFRDQRARMALPRLNKEEAETGRLVRSIEHQVAEAKKRFNMVVANQAAAARRAGVDATDVRRDKLFEIICPDGRKVRHRGASQEDVQRRLQVGYSIAGQIFGANVDDTGGFIPRPGFLAAVLQVYKAELLAFLEENGFSKQPVVVLPNNNRDGVLQ